MGRISKADINEFKVEGFKALELNEGNVQAIFNRCLATGSTTEYIKSILQQKKFGYQEDSNPILFDKKKLLENLKHIRYLYGQLATTHEHSNTISIEKDNVDNVMTNYTRNIWTENKRNINAIFPLRCRFGYYISV